MALGDNQKVTRQKKRRYNEINHVTSVRLPCQRVSFVTSGTEGLTMDMQSWVGY